MTKKLFASTLQNIGLEFQGYLIHMTQTGDWGFDKDDMRWFLTATGVNADLAVAMNATGV